MKKIRSQDVQLISSETRIDYVKYNGKVKDPSLYKGKIKITDWCVLANCTYYKWHNLSNYPKV